MTSPEPAGVVTPDRFGSYAGPATRLVAFVLDVFVASAMFALLTVTVSVVVAIFTGGKVQVQVSQEVGIPAELAWLFLYFFVSWATVGKTPGMSAVGLQVVRRHEGKVSAGRAALRTLVFPFSFILGLGFVGVVVGRERRALHDVAADTIVVYG